MRPKQLFSLLTGALLVAAAVAAQTPPTEVQQPGTQPGQVAVPTSSVICSACHSNIDPSCFFCHPDMEEESDPWTNWRGSMMGHASSDPMFWAALTVAEQDFPGSGNFCMRCHVPIGWLAGRAEPSDGSAFTNMDLDGVSCEVCHKLTDPDGSEHAGVQQAPFLAHDGGSPPKAFRGSGMHVIWGGAERLGPYDNATASHPWMQSQFHRSSDLCATCHDVSNPIVGDLAHNNGAPIPLPPGKSSGVPGSPVEQKAAFLNEPHKYGVVERTASEHRASSLDTLPVSKFRELPVELRAGSLEEAWRSAVRVRPDGHYADGTPRSFSCQTCHMPPVQGRGANLLVAPQRTDNPRHDLTGGNYWMGEAMKWLDSQGRLRASGPYWPELVAAIDSGADRARETLRDAAGLAVVEGSTVRIVNRTGHKLITGYPEGRRMWLRTRWYSVDGGLLRTDGEYGPITAMVDGAPRQVETLVDPTGPNTHVVEAVLGMTQLWARQLIEFGANPNTPLAFDRQTGVVRGTLAELSVAAPGSAQPTFHFALNNQVIRDNRIPPYGLSYDEAREFNALPEPATQFGNPGPGGTFEHWVDVRLTPPLGAASADIELCYQPTSWEYVQFLYLANDGTHPFNGSTGRDLLDAWFATGMAAPEVIARTQWGLSAPVAYCEPKVNSLGCTPRIGWFGEPSAHLDDGFQIVVRNLRNKRPGILLYSRAGRAAQPFQGGTLCLAAPVVRTAEEPAGGSPTGNDCTGGLSVDFNRIIAAGGDPGLVAGATVNAQFWARDPGFAAPNATSLSDAIEFVIRP
ncbi:MAG: hypothetical protein IPK67_03865 [Planctomycetes bacterium]|nr:hypothetical protein [Planctomycetota bacterium]